MYNNKDENRLEYLLIGFCYQGKRLYYPSVLIHKYYLYPLDELSKPVISAYIHAFLLSELANNSLRIIFSEIPTSLSKRDPLWRYCAKMLSV